MNPPGVAIVTGGLDRLGGAIAARLAEDGWALALHCRETCAPSSALAAAIARTGVRSHIIQADLDEPDAAAGIVAQVLERFGTPPTCLVNSASMISEGGWDAVDADALMQHHRLNVVAPVLLVKELAGALPPGVDGAVINLLDQRVLNPPLDQAAYTASKLALANLTRVLARAFAPRVRVNAVAPGLTIPGEDYAADQVERLTAMMPLQRLPQPPDVADAVAFLARARLVTGQTVFVDGGASLESWPRDFVYMEREG